MKRAFGLLCLIVGGIGLVVSLALVPAAWIARGYVNDQIAALTGGVHAPLDRTEAATSELRGRVEAVRGRIRQVGEQATAAAERGTIDQQLAKRLVTLLDETLGAEYVQLREAFVAIRERVAVVADAADRSRLLLPAVSIPAPTTDDLARVDQHFKALDASLREMRADLATGTLSGSNLPRQVADGAMQLEAWLGEVVSIIDRITLRVQEMRTALGEAQARLELYATIATIIATLFLLYVAGLHLALIVAGRDLRTSRTVVGSMPIDSSSSAPTSSPSRAESHNVA